MSEITHMVTVRSRSGKRINPVTLGSSAFAACYGETDLKARLEVAEKDPDLEVSVREMSRARPG